MPAPDEDEGFVYDILDNRITLNRRVGADVVYASNTVTKYTDIGGVGALYDDCGVRSSYMCLCQMQGNGTWYLKFTWYLKLTQHVEAHLINR